MVKGDEGQRPLTVLPRGRRIAVTAGIMLGMFLGALEATVMGTAMPTVVAQLGGLEHYSWVFTAYMLTSTATVPIWGRLSDLYGRRTTYMIGVGLFLLGSMLCGLSTSMVVLVLFRAVQGLGAGAIVPIGLTIIGEIYTLRERARMQAVFSSVWGVGSIVGPLIGGFLTDALSWRWVFFVNVPFGLAAVAVLHATYADRPRSGQVRVDWLGGALLLAAVSILLAGLSGLTLPRWPWIVGGVVLTGLFVAVERRVGEPMLPLDALGDRASAAAFGTATFVGMAIFGAIAFIPLYVRATTGASATEAGATLTPLMLGWVGTAILAARLMLRVGHRPTIVTGTGLMTAALVVLALMGPETRRLWLLADVTLLGAGSGLANLTLLLFVQAQAAPERLGLATSLQQFGRSIGGAVGTAIMGAIFAARLGVEAGGEGDLLGVTWGGPEMAERFASALGGAFIAGAVMAAVALLIALRLPPLVRSGRVAETGAPAAREPEATRAEPPGREPHRITGDREAACTRDGRRGREASGR
ncbi:MAG TPA: MDR family MFS transporter [Thermodesulfobacteriota bacterium]